MNFTGQHVAAPLYEAVGPESFALVAEWLQGVVSAHAIEAEGRVIAPSLPWLVEAVTFYDPPTVTRQHSPAEASGVDSQHDSDPTLPAASSTEEAAGDR